MECELYVRKTRGTVMLHPFASVLSFSTHQDGQICIFIVALSQDCYLVKTTDAYTLF